jgi:hypothetical protein
MKITLTLVAGASSNVTIQDPNPVEGPLHITLAASQTKTLSVTEAQYNHLKSQLDAYLASGALTSYTVKDTEEERSEEKIELAHRINKVATLAVTGGAVPNLLTYVRPGDVFVKHVAAGADLSYTVKAVHAATIFEATTAVVAFNLAAAGDSFYFTRDGSVITATLRTVAGGLTAVTATVSDVPYLKPGYGQIYFKADGKPYALKYDGTELSLGMTGSDPLIFKGTIALATEFPLLAAVQTGWLYRVTADVTDSGGGGRTGTTQTFMAGTEIAWTGVPGPTGWANLGMSGEADLRIATASPVTILDTDRYIGCLLAVPGAVAIDLETAVGRAGKMLTFFDITGDAATNPITLHPAGAQVINNEAHYVINRNFGSATIVSDGTGWTLLHNEANLKHIDTVIALKKKVVNVDGNRSDTYTADGSIERPYKTLAAAVAVAVAGDTIVASPRIAGAYAENIVLANGVSIEGSSGTYTYIDGSVTLGTDPCTIKYIAFTGITNVLTIQGGTSIRDVVTYGQVSVAATGKVQGWNFHVYSTGRVAVTVAAGGEFYNVMGKISTTGAFSAISSVGNVILELVEVSSSAAAQNTIEAITSGYLRLFNTSVVNADAAKAINAANAAGVAAPNVFSTVIVSSAGVNAIDVGAAVTQYNNVTTLGGTITGAGIVKGVNTDGAVMETDYTGAGILRATTASTPVLATNYGLEHFDSRQGAPGDEVLRVFRANAPGKVVAASVDCRVAPTGAQELTFNIFVNAVSVVTAALTLTNASVGGTQYDFTIDTGVDSDFIKGDIITVVRSGYVVGGGTLLDTCVDIDVIRV